MKIMPANDTLSERERETLRLLATGASNKEIARHLFISVNTVKVHLRNIFAKIGVTSRTEAAVYAIREGLTQAADLPAAAPATQELPIAIPAPLEKKNKLHSLWIAALVTVLLVGVVTLVVTTYRSPTIAVASPAPAASQRWQELAALPTARCGLAVAVYENQIYAIGGETAQGVTGVVEQYDVATDTWITLTSKPVPVADINAAVIGGKIYIPGGRLASGGIWDLNSHALRPAGWTSADAAGLPILPGLVRYDEILAGQINHAIRFTASATDSTIWPARHLTSGSPGVLTSTPPMGARFRLKASYDISSFAPEVQVILQAMKTYGIILADNGSDWYVSGAPDERWDNDMLHTLDALTGDDFEAVDESGLMVDPNSGQTGASPAYWHPAVGDTLQIQYAGALDT